MSAYGKAVAVVLAAGSGKRMGTDTPKQLLDLCEKPVIYWTLRAFEESIVDAVVLVAPPEVAERIEPSGFRKVKRVVPGGEERYHSVLAGLRGVEDEAVGGADFVLIHDGARCLVTPELIERTLADAARYGAAVAAVPVKDTIKRVSPDGFAAETLDRSELRQMQTPQTFSFPMIKEAYENLMRRDPLPPVTDDAEVLALTQNRRTFLSEGSYENLKLTTPDDLVAAEAILWKREAVDRDFSE